ncbi:MAG TPA: YceI family protein [Methylomirabilota bacterium]|nr:YceI family protein [Methylomirabilota bacterium]
MTRRRALLLLLPAALLTLGALAAAEPRRYAIQLEASEITFKATSRLMDADGRFHRFSGEVVLDPDNPAGARVALSIEAASIDTGIAMRDRHLRSGDFFDVERFPTITFESTRVELAGSRATVVGRLTLHGVTREIAVPVTVQLSERALLASGEFSLNRADYGIRYSSWFNPVGNMVSVAFTLRAR